MPFPNLPELDVRGYRNFNGTLSEPLVRVALQGNRNERVEEGCENTRTNSFHRNVTADVMAMCYDSNRKPPSRGGDRKWEPERPCCHGSRLLRFLDAGCLQLDFDRLDFGFHLRPFGMPLLPVARMSQRVTHGADELVGNPELWA